MYQYGSSQWNPPAEQAWGTSFRSCLLFEKHLKAKIKSVQSLRCNIYATRCTSRTCRHYLQTLYNCELVFESCSVQYLAIRVRVPGARASSPLQKLDRANRLR